MSAQAFNECDACGHEVSGYTKKDLATEGWQWHDAGADRTFVMCGDCVELYEQRRLTKAA